MPSSDLRFFWGRDGSREMGRWKSLPQQSTVSDTREESFLETASHVQALKEPFSTTSQNPASSTSSVA